MDQKDEKPGQHQLLGGSAVPTTAKRFSTKNRYGKIPISVPLRPRPHHETNRT
jgi:hypothetical protein